MNKLLGFVEIIFVYVPWHCVCGSGIF